MRFEAEIARGEAILLDVVRERVYGNVRVRAEWPPDLATAEIRLTVVVLGHDDRRDGPHYVELFFHDLFLLLNLSSPGSFGGTISISAAELRVRELSFSARLFESARGVRRLPLPEVVAWYERLQLGSRQLADDGVAVALFQLLHLARGEEDEERSILRLAVAAEALGIASAVTPRLFELRDDLAHGRARVFHPMHDDALDPRVADATREWIDVADEAAGAVIAALQQRVRG